jgi:hypothetical protein
MNARTDLKMTREQAVTGYFKYPTKPHIPEPVKTMKQQSQSKLRCDHHGKDKASN